MPSQYPGISSRAVIGMFYKRLAADFGASWIPGVSMLFNSDQELTQNMEQEKIRYQIHQWLTSR